MSVNAYHIWTRNPLREARMVSNGKQHQADYIDYDVLSGYNSTCAGVAELADAADLKSAGAILVGSSPTLGTKESNHALVDNSYIRLPSGFYTHCLYCRTSTQGQRYQANRRW